jgi:hypothetical protein
MVQIAEQLGLGFKVGIDNVKSADSTHLANDYSHCDAYDYSANQKQKFHQISPFVYFSAHFF